jgi:hypothetical protein
MVNGIRSLHRQQSTVSGRAVAYGLVLLLGWILGPLTSLAADNDLAAREREARLMVHYLSYGTNFRADLNAMFDETAKDPNMPVWFVDALRRAASTEKYVQFAVITFAEQLTLSELKAANAVICDKEKRAALELVAVWARENNPELFAKRIRELKERVGEVVATEIVTLCTSPAMAKLGKAEATIAAKRRDFGIEAFTDADKKVRARGR